MTIPDPVLDLPLAGLRLDGSSLRLLLRAVDRPVLTIFLRHLGCIFCREMVRDARAAADREAGYPPVVFVCQADADEAGDFFERYWPGTRVICDPEKKLYDGFGLGHGSFAQLFGPRVWACGIRAVGKGNFIGRPVGDPWTMPGVFLIDQTGTVLWRHEFAHAGDHPDFSAVPRQAGGAAPTASSTSSSTLRV